LNINLVSMNKKSFQTVCLLIMLSILISSVAYAFIYETKTQTVTQTILRKWLSGWDKRVRITIDHNDAQSSLSNFPILIHLSSASGIYSDNVTFIFNEVGSNSKKIAVTTSNSTQCYVEIEKWVLPNPTTEALRPNAAGDTTQISSVYPTGTPHWQTVDEETADGDTSYVSTSSTSSSYQTDLYNLPTPTGSGTINSVTVYFRFRTTSTYYTAYGRAAVKTYGTIYNGTVESTASTSYDTRSYTWTNNPYTGSSWTWAEIDTLQAGLGTRISNAFGSSRCTQVYAEINVTPPGGEAWLWTKVPSMSSTADTTLYLYYDRDHVDNTAYVGDTGSTPARNVWDNNFKGVWHLTEDPSGATPQMKDSTSNANNGASAGSMTSGDQVTAEIDGGLDFDGSDDEVDCQNTASLQITPPLTIESWAKPASTGVYMGIAGKLVDSTFPYTYKGYALAKADTDKFRFLVASSDSIAIIDSNSAYAETNWHHIVGVRTNTTAYLYVDGAQQTGNSTQALSDSGDDFRIGRQYANYDGRWWNGLIDEIRISNTARSAAWINASYESGRDHLVDFGNEETF
jgi:hypothetical protein